MKSKEAKPLHLSSITGLDQKKKEVREYESEIESRIEFFVGDSPSKGFDYIIDRPGNKINLYMRECCMDIPINIFIQATTEKQVLEFWKDTKKTTEDKRTKEFAQWRIEEIEDGE